MPQVRAGLAPTRRRHRPWPGFGGELPLPLWDRDERSSLSRVGVRGSGLSMKRNPSPGSHLAMRSDLSRKGRGEAAPQPSLRANARPMINSAKQSSLWMGLLRPHRKASAKCLPLYITQPRYNNRFNDDIFRRAIALGHSFFRCCFSFERYCIAI
jgi:hypothetical protein